MSHAFSLAHGKGLEIFLVMNIKEKIIITVPGSVNIAWFSFSGY